MQTSEIRSKFREVLEGDACVHPGSVFDPISARIAEDLGFEVGMFAGSIASATVLGAPDYIVLTLTELSDQIRRICRASDLPLLIDADHGYGNALNAKRTIEELENSGASAVTIEDTLLPRTYQEQSVGLISIDEGLGKIKAAISGRTDSSMVVAARTSAFQLSDSNDAIKRAVAYEQAGADAIFFTGISEREQLELIAESVTIPIMLGPVNNNLNDLVYLSKMGVRIVLQGHLPFMASIKAVHDTLKALRNGTSPESIEQELSYSEILQRSTRKEDYDRSISEFL
jgi:carboxyvinyl-carboxyphosphonate phosphorylmutase